MREIERETESLVATYVVKVVKSILGKRATVIVRRV